MRRLLAAIGMGLLISGPAPALASIRSQSGGGNGSGGAGLSGGSGSGGSASSGSSGGASPGGTSPDRTGGASSSSTGGASPGGLAPTSGQPSSSAPPPSRRAHGEWLSDTTVTEYWPAPEAWFTGALVKVPGLRTEHRIDWLYSALGVSMQGEGLGLDGKLYHIDAIGSAGWVTAAGHSTSPSDGWAAGAPFWRAGAYWRNRRGGVTFPVAAGGWSAGTGRSYVPLPGVTFAVGASLPLRFYQSVAVDPTVIPLGSRVYIPAYRRDGHGGWFVAQDTGGAIRGHHVDVYRNPPADPSDTGQYLTGQRIYVIPAKAP